VRFENLRTVLLSINTAVHLLAGFFLVLFPLKIVDLLGLPVEMPPFYASILGGVLVGIGMVLLLGSWKSSGVSDGLGLIGVLFIDLFAALTLAALLISGRIFIPLRGYLILLGLTFFLLLLCGVELLVHQSDKNLTSGKSDE